MVGAAAMALPPALTAEDRGLRRRRRKPVPSGALLLLLLCAAALTLSEALSVYKGCWEDRDAGPNERAMSAVQLIPLPRAIAPEFRRATDIGDSTLPPPRAGADGVGAVTATACVRTCDTLGYAYAGVSNGD